MLVSFGYGKIVRFFFTDMGFVISSIDYFVQIWGAVVMFVNWILGFI